MADLMHFAKDNPSLRPDQAMENLVGQYDSQGGVVGQQAASDPSNQNPHIMLPPNGLQQQQQNFANNQIPRPPPSQNQQQGQFSSPAFAPSQLPNGGSPLPNQPHNPHLTNLQGNPNNVSTTPSPHMPLMAPPMQLQHSQQGTNSSAASANTSPMVSNKRRRSTVKLEGDEGGGSGEGGQGMGGGPGQGGGQGRVKPSPRMGKKGKPQQQQQGQQGQ